MKTAGDSNTSSRYFNPDASDALPNSIKERPQWITWVLASKGDRKLAKIPADPNTGRAINAQDSNNWLSFRDAVAAFRANVQLSGIGYVLSTNDEVTGIDMDGCRDSESGKVADWAMAHVSQFGSYSEVSPSGTGIRVLVRGKPEAGHPTAQGKREIYSKARFLTITGNCLAEPGELREAPKAVANYIDMMTAEKGRTSQRREVSTSSELPSVIGEQRNNILTRAAGKLRRIGLGHAELEASLQAINIERCRPILETMEVSQIARSVARYSASDDQLITTPPVNLDLVSIRDLEHADLPDPEHIIDRILPVGVTSSLGGHGGSGKTFLSLVLAACVAAGRPFLGLDVASVPVLFYSAEDGKEILRWRLQQICNSLGIPPKELGRRLQIIDATEIDPTLFSEKPIRYSEGSIKRGIATPTFDALSQKAIEFEARLIIIDNASDTYEANENDRPLVRAFIRSLTGLARRTNGALLLLNHVDKATAKAGGSTQGYSGSTAWHNSVRSRLFLHGDGEGKNLTLVHQKANFGETAEDLLISWDQGTLVAGHIHQRQDAARDRLDTEQQAQILRMIHERSRRDQYISTSRTAGNAWTILSALDEFPRIDKRGFWRLMDKAETSGRLKRESYRDAKRMRKERFTVTTTGQDWCRMIEAEIDG